MADEIIDLTAYFDRDDEDEDEDLDGGVFSLFGAEGERSRFALPLWRAVYVSRGDRGAVVSTPLGEQAPVDPFVVLDLAQDPARLDFSSLTAPLRKDSESPVVHELSDSALMVYLGDGIGRSWYVAVDGGERDGPLDRKGREEVLFLSGECAGLLFFREMASHPR